MVDVILVSSGSCPDNHPAALKHQSEGYEPQARQGLRAQERIIGVQAQFTNVYQRGRGFE
jgi:hypothetical protein